MERWEAGVLEQVEGSAGEGSVRTRGVGGEGARERLFRLGASALTDPELLSVLLGSGPRAQACAEGLLASSGGLKALFLRDPMELCGLAGLGPVRVGQMQAALELGRRAQRATERRPRLRNPREIYGYLAPHLSALRREVFHVLCFNARNTLLYDARVAEGTMNTCPVDPREVFAAALACRATGIVLAHNHPSGDPEPSMQDVNLTVQLCDAAKLLGIKVLDHVVVGDGSFVSMAERGQVPDAEREGLRRWSAGGGW